MKKRSLKDRYLLAKPSTRSIIEWGILFTVGIVGTLLSRPQILFPIGNIFGVILILVGGGIHGASHMIHEKAHEEAGKVERLVTTGIYSKIRHPGYLGLILLNFGIAFAWGLVSLVVLVTFYAYLSVETAKKVTKTTK